MIQIVNKHGSFGTIQDVDFRLDNHAWEILLQSDNRKDLETALQWSDSAVNLALRSANQYNVPNWMDTKANLLYKLGRVREAIQVQQDAVALSPDAEDLLHNLKKMQQGRPTWKE
jgi:tetratricopeptide (TPR) repeat protein